MGEIACHIHHNSDLEMHVGLLKKLLAVTFRQHSSLCISNSAAIANFWLKDTIWLDLHRSRLRFTEEQFKNCATVNRISVQSEYPQKLMFSLCQQATISTNSVVSFTTRQYLISKTFRCDDAIGLQPTLSRSKTF